MRFAFRLATGNDITLHAVTGLAAWVKLRAMTLPGFAVKFGLEDVVLCSIWQDDYEASHTNDEMLQAGQEVVDCFGREMHQRVDAEVHVEPYN